MRIHLTTTPSKTIVPFNYQPVLTGSMHKWLGDNPFHDTISLYSFSWLNGGEITKKGMQFLNGASFFISGYNPAFVKELVNGIRKDPDIAFGLSVNEIMIQEDPQFGHERIFHPGSPIFIKRSIEGKDYHYTWEDPEANVCLTETLQHKLRKAGLDDKNIRVGFDPDYRNRKIKTIYYNKIGNKVNMSAVKITGSPEQLAFAWNVGVGNSTGIGFGALK